MSIDWVLWKKRFGVRTRVKTRNEEAWLDVTEYVGWKTKFPLKARAKRKSERRSELSSTSCAACQASKKRVNGRQPRFG